MKQKIIEHIKSLMKEHEEAGYCTNYDIAQDELNKSVDNAFDYSYDCGRYEAFYQLLTDIKNMEE